MKKVLLALISVCGIGLVSVAFAADDFKPFITIQDAIDNCPALDGLTFIPKNRSVPNSVGTVHGNHCDKENKCKTFESIYDHTPPVHPKNMDEKSGLIADAVFRSVDGLYGYISGDVTTCYYSYTTFLNAQYGLLLRSQR